MDLTKTRIDLQDSYRALWHVVKGLKINIYWKERYKGAKIIDKGWSSGLHIMRCKDKEQVLTKDDKMIKTNLIELTFLFIWDLWDLW
jgi:hypothetical protein